MTCLGREGPRTQVLDIPKDACPQARSKAPRWRPGKSAPCACRGRAEAEAGRRGGHEAHSSGVGIPAEGPGPPLPLSSLRAQALQGAPHCPPPVPAGRTQAEPRELRGTTCPRGGIPRATRGNDGAGRGAEDARPGALRRRGRRGWGGSPWHW